MLRCLVLHRWITKPRYLNLVSESHPAYRKCKWCGKTQFGIPDGQSLRISWSTVRKGDFSDAQDVRHLRGYASRLTQIAHALRLRRTRAIDRSGQEFAHR